MIKHKNNKHAKSKFLCMIVFIYLYCFVCVFVNDLVICFSPRCLLFSGDEMCDIEYEIVGK